MSCYLIAGGSGLIGTALKKRLESEGHEVRILSRGKSRADQGIYHWNVEQSELDEEALIGVDYLINLAGSGVVDKAWTVKYKTEILESRVNAIRLLLKNIRLKGIQLKGVASASAIGYYGDRPSNELIDESAKAGAGFLPAVCMNWEEVNRGFKELGIPTSIFRIGIVLSTKGGALYSLLRLAKLFLLAPLGNGKQMTSWIHIDDLAKMIQFGLNRAESKVYNAVAPQAVSNRSFSKAVAKAAGRPMLAPFVPKLAIKLFMGERAQAILMGSNVVPKNALEAGFDFEHPNLEASLRDLVG